MVDEKVKYGVDFRPEQKVVVLFFDKSITGLNLSAQEAKVVGHRLIEEAAKLEEALSN